MVGGVKTPKPPTEIAVEIWPVTMPIPYARNARVCPDSAIGKVAASIKEFGFKNPILVDREGVIIAGHTRLLAAERLGLSEVPVIVCADLSPARVKALRLADNRTAQETTWEYAMLNIELEELASDGFDVSLTGFDPDELVGLNPMPDAGDQETMVSTEVWGVIIECAGEEEQVRLLQRFTDEGLRVRGLMG